MTSTIVPDAELVLFSLVLSFCSMLAGASASSQGSEKKRYASYNKPWWAPPGWAFGPIWIILYTLIGLAFWLVRRDRLYDNIIPQMVLSYVLLALLAAWTWLFFRFDLRGLAFLEILATLGVAIATTVMFWMKEWGAGVMLLPLDIWLVMAMILNAYAIEL